VSPALSDLPVRKVIRALESAGFAYVRTKGSHAVSQLRRAGRGDPEHGTIKRRTLGFHPSAGSPDPGRIPEATGLTAAPATGRTDGGRACRACLVGALAMPQGSGGRTVECPGEYTVLMVAARQALTSEGVGRPGSGTCLGRARRGRADHAGHSPRSGGLSRKNAIRVLVRFGAPSRIRTCAHGSGVQSRIQPLPAGTRPALHARGAYGARGIVVLSFVICRHRLP